MDDRGLLHIGHEISKAGHHGKFFHYPWNPSRGYMSPAAHTKQFTLKPYICKAKAYCKYHGDKRLCRLLENFIKAQ